MWTWPDAIARIEATRAELGAAVIARHHCGDVADTAVQQHCEHRAPCRAMWLAVIVLFPILGSAVYFGVRSDW